MRCICIYSCSFIASRICENIKNRKEYKQVRIEISFSDFNFNDQDYLYGSLFGKKELINDANNESDVLLRVKDDKGNVIIDEFQVSSDKSSN
ncbi:hypothetical protein J6TS1_43520 [Siminovitchia terrae]|uniref:Uncharacterized protein n=1 Tax=Siminovitchia terrae TaxID=1914933 RepID=A0ABQ4L4G9_SIMTE|nr:hypothetical protein J22TS1_42460 [Siminovitchia terrae]GIN98482.1 hypothetical protein J6TS1_43520 [Siminovitchia terrae]